MQKELPQLNWTYQKNGKLNGLTLNYWKSELPKDDCFVVGIDPGRNLGICILDFTKETAFALFYKTEQGSYPLMGFSSFYFVSNLIGNFYPQTKNRIGAVEGASFGSTYRQDYLSQIRFACAFSLYTLGMKVKIIPPLSARKLAFGSGKKKASDVWVKLNSNAADAVGIALAALLYR